jgi:signal transduction histidine kinase
MASSPTSQKSARRKAQGERDARGAAAAASERAVTESTERRLTRLGFDLHDGPIQEVVLLAQDLRLLASRLDGILGTRAERELVRGRIEDLDAQLVALEASLRRLSSEVRAPLLPDQHLDRPLKGVLRDLTTDFAARTAIEPTLVLHGDPRPLSASQRIALLNIVHEALTNIREHSDATEVEVEVSVDAAGVRARIADNGCGFDVESTLIRAAREGRVGLAAMKERVRLLGGRCAIDSWPGGPTVVNVALERYVCPCPEGTKPFSKA